jgi:AsmA protein
MRTVKILAGRVGGIIVLAVAAVLTVWLLVKPNDYKARIATAVTESTGRELVVAGDIKLSAFPWVALEFGPASLGNLPGFGEEPFLAIKHATLRVKLFSLLARRLEIERVDLDGVDLRLRKTAVGRGNWEGFGPKHETAAGVDGDGKTSGHMFPLAGLGVTNGRMSYPGVVVEKFDLQVGAFGGQGATPVSITLNGNRGVTGESVSLNAHFDLSAEPDNKRLRLAAVNFSGLLSRPGDGSPAHWDLSAPALEVDLPEQTLSLPAFALSYSSAHVTGNLQATKILDDLGMTGTVTLAPLVLREIAPRLRLVLPHTRDPKVFTQVSGSGSFAYDADGVRWDPLQLTVDDTHLKGSVARVGEPRVWKFELAADQIDLGRYLPNESGAAGPAAKTVVAESGTAEISGSTAPAAGSSTLPEAEGTLTVGALHFSPLDFSSVRLTLASKDGVAHFFPAQAQIDGGSYSGNVTVDDRGAAPVLSLDEHLSGVDMVRLLAGTSYKGRMAGRGIVNVKATAHGAVLDGVMRSLNGHFDANLTGGALEGVDLGYEIGMARALIEHEAAPTRSNPPRTKFDAFKMSAEISNGVAKTTDLTIASTALRLTGQGSANLVNKGIDFRILASVLKSSGANLVDIPLNITGTYVDPRVRPDVDALAKGQLKQKLQDILQKNGLGGLFSK